MSAAPAASALPPSTAARPPFAPEPPPQTPAPSLPVAPASLLAPPASQTLTMPSTGQGSLGAQPSPAPLIVAGAYLPPSATFGSGSPERAASKAPDEGSGAASAGPLPLARLGDLHLEAPADLPAWFVAAGSVASIVGFLLPWGSNGMIGGGPDPDFFSRWGLANAANLVPALLAFGALYLQLGSNVPRTVLRTGAVGLALGGLLAGLTFVYATSAFGLGTGGTIVAIGAIGLVVGGLLAVAPRHRSGEPPV